MKSYTNITTLYVSQKNGDDAHLGISPVNDAIMNGPFKTLDRAFKIISDMRYSGVRQPLEIAVMDEEYTFSYPITLSAVNGAQYRTPTAVSDVTIRPYGNEKVMFSGGRKISGWTEDTFNGVSCISAYLPDVKDGKWNFTDLYVNSRPAKRTRTPDTGYFYPEKVEKEWKGVYDDSSTWFIAREGDIPKNAHNVCDAEIIFGHFWVDEHSKIASFDPVTRKTCFSGKTRMTICSEKNQAATMEYFIENLAEAFKNPGEWYLDRTEGKLYYILNKGETAENITVYAPVVDRILSISGDNENGNRVHGIHFKNIVFAYTKGDRTITRNKTLPDGSVETETVMADAQAEVTLHGVVNLEGATSCTIENCAFCAFGSHAIVIGKGCCDCKVLHTDVKYGGGGGAYIKGGAYEEPEYTHTHHNTVSDCTFKELGLRWYSSIGVVITHGYSNEISHNEISHLYYSGISVGWVWGYKDSVTHGNIISKNHIYDLGKGFLSDMGGIYTLGPQNGTRIEYNVIHDVKSRNYGGWGLYTDEGSSYITLFGNVCYRCSCNAYMQHYGMMNSVTNNIFADSGETLVCMGYLREGFNGLVFGNNIYVLEKGKPVYNDAVTACNIATDRNFILSSEEDPVMLNYAGKSFTLSEVRNKLGFDENSLILNPNVINFENEDFSVKADSEICKMGFQPIDLTDVGPRK